MSDQRQRLVEERGKPMLMRTAGKPQELLDGDRQRHRRDQDRLTETITRVQRGDDDDAGKPTP